MTGQYQSRWQSSWQNRPPIPGSPGRLLLLFHGPGPIESIGTEQDARDEDARGAERGRTGRSSRRPAARSRPNLDQSRRRATLKARARRARRVIFRLPEARGSGGVAEVFQLRGE